MSGRLERATARDLAQRWASKCQACRSDRGAPDCHAECTDSVGRPLPPLTDEARAILFSHVLDLMAQFETKPRTWAVNHVGVRLGLAKKSARALCDAAEES